MRLELEWLRSDFSITIIEINNWNTQHQLVEIVIGIDNFSHNWNLIVIEMHIYSWISSLIMDYFYN